MSRGSKRMTLDQFASETKRVAEEWAASQDIKSMVFAILERDAKLLVAKLLGFDLRGGEWTVDHCNGRAGESAAGDYLRKAAGNGVKEWLDKVASDLPPLPAAARKRIVSRYHEWVERGVCDLLEELAQKEAKEIVNQIIRDAVSLKPGGESCDVRGDATCAAVAANGGNEG